MYYNYTLSTHTLHYVVKVVSAVIQTCSFEKG